MENKNMIDELEQVCEQMQVLREKLDKQEIVNDRLVRNSVKSKMSWVKKFVYLEFLLLPVLACVWFGIKEVFNLSWTNYAILMIMSTVDAIWDYRINVASLDLDRVADNSLTDTLQKLVRMKKMRAKSFFVMLPLCALWLVWTGIEMWQYVSTITFKEDFLTGAAYGGFGGLFVGLPLGLYAVIRIYRKMQRTNDELIEQIKDFAE